MAAAEQVPEGVDLAVQKMKQGETAEVTIAPQYAFGAEGAQRPGGAVPPDATVVYTIELHSFQNVRLFWSLLSLVFLGCLNPGLPGFVRRNSVSTCRRMPQACTSRCSPLGA